MNMWLLQLVQPLVMCVCLFVHTYACMLVRYIELLNMKEAHCYFTDMELVEEVHEQAVKLRQDQITRNDVSRFSHMYMYMLVITVLCIPVAIGTVQETV